MVVSQETTTRSVRPSFRRSRLDVLCTSLYTIDGSKPLTARSVTSVGGTTIIGTEWGSPFSGGGFSNYWSRPAYQSEAVSHYLSLLGSNDSGLYNASGRGYPDVSAYSVGFDVIVDGEVNTEVGTSCSAPTWASVIALLNDRLVSAGKPALGFLNPFLYSKGAAALTDIVNGNNRWCTNDTGFEATVGWDPVCCTPLIRPCKADGTRRFIPGHRSWHSELHEFKDYFGDLMLRIGTSSD